MGERPQEQSTKDKIIALLRKGYNRGQLIHDFDFAERTVDSAIKEYKELGGDDPEQSGGQALLERDRLAVRKEKESVLPEWVALDVANLFDGSVRDQRILLTGIAIPLLGLRLFTEAVSPLSQLMSVWQQGQAEAARAVQQSGIDIAQQAAQEALSGAMPQILEAVKQQGSGQSPNPMASMMADIMRPYLTQLMGSLMGAFLPGVQQPTPAGQPQAMPPGGSEVSEQEIKEAFGDES